VGCAVAEAREAGRALPGLAGWAARAVLVTETTSASWPNCPVPGLRGSSMAGVACCTRYHSLAWPPAAVPPTGAVTPAGAWPAS
jgi:hypothetical protein